MCVFIYLFICTFPVSEDPPRPQEGSPLFLEMGGYMAARGDFNVEHNNFVELELKDMAFDEEKEDSEDEDDEHFMRGTFIFSVVVIKILLSNTNNFF